MRVKSHQIKEIKWQNIVVGIVPISNVLAEKSLKPKNADSNVRNKTARPVRAFLLVQTKAVLPKSNTPTCFSTGKPLSNRL